jgi:hypothetical protein
MSRVEVTPLLPGEVATSADVNATLQSWSDNTGPGDISGPNVRLEGIDRRTMSAAEHVVYTTASGTATTVITSSGAVSNITGVYAVVPSLLTANLTFATNQQIIVHASTYFEVDTDAAQQTVRLIMQSSTNGGGAWSDMVGTEQYFRVRDAYSAAPVGFTDVATPFPGIATSASWGVYFTAVAASTCMFRIAFQTTLAAPTVTFENGTIFTETFNF